MNTQMNDVDAPGQKIRDVYLAAYLQALGYHLLRWENPSPHTNYYFSGVPEGKEFDYYNAAAEEVSPRNFFESFKTMRSLSQHVEWLPSGLLGVRDIYLAAWLHYKEYKIARIEPTAYQYRFVFHDVPLECILSFYNCIAETVQVKKLMQAFRNVRDLAAYRDPEESHT